MKLVKDSSNDNDVQSMIRCFKDTIRLINDLRREEGPSESHSSRKKIKRTVNGLGPDRRHGTAVDVYGVSNVSHQMIFMHSSQFRRSNMFHLCVLGTLY